MFDAFWCNYRQKKTGIFHLVRCSSNIFSWRFSDVHEIWRKLVPISFFRQNCWLRQDSFLRKQVFTFKLTPRHYFILPQRLDSLFWAQVPMDWIAPSRFLLADNQFEEGPARASVVRTSSTRASSRGCLVDPWGGLMQARAKLSSARSRSQFLQANIHLI